jgi:hypothetical protein
MQKYTSYVPAEKRFRLHLQSVLGFVHTYLLSVEANMFPDDGIEKVMPDKKFTELLLRIEKAGDTGEIGLSSNNLLTIYSSYAIMNKLLFSHYGFTMFHKFEGGISEGHFLKEFPAYRQHYKSGNDHFIEDIEKKFPNLKGLKELKLQIAGLLNEFN